MQNGRRWGGGHEAERNHTEPHAITRGKIFSMGAPPGLRICRLVALEWPVRGGDASRRSWECWSASANAGIGSGGSSGPGGVACFGVDRARGSAALRGHGLARTVQPSGIKAPNPTASEIHPLDPQRPPDRRNHDGRSEQTDRTHFKTCCSLPTRRGAAFMLNEPMSPSIVVTRSEFFTCAHFSLAHSSSR